MKNNILETLYKARVDAISKLNTSDMTILQNEISNIAATDVEFEECIKKITDSEIRIQLKEILDNKIETEKEISMYIREKFYKVGFADAVELLLKTN